MLTLIEQADVYAPEHLGVQSILLAGSIILKLGEIDRQAVLALGMPCTVVDAAGCLAVPGLIDPHAHLIGAGGEQGFASRVPEVALDDIVSAGVTTVVGCLGTDTYTRHLTTLLAKVRQLDQQGVSAYMYTGGFQVPTPTLTGTVPSDLIIADKIIGVGEIAIADTRSLEPSLHELAKLVSEATDGGLLAGKAGITHFHVGPARQRLSLLHDLLERHELEPRYLYPTHITRSEALLDEAIALARRGAYVDMDTIDENLGPCLRYYLDHGGPPDRLTVSSDANTQGGSQRKLYGQFVACLREHDFAIDTVLPLFTRNVADALQLQHKGRLQPGADGDALILNQATLDIVHVFGRGRHLVRAGQLVGDAPAANT